MIVFKKAEAAVAPINEIRQIIEDLQYKMRGAFMHLEEA